MADRVRLPSNWNAISASTSMFEPSEALGFSEANCRRRATHIARPTAAVRELHNRALGCGIRRLAPHLARLVAARHHCGNGARNALRTRRPATTSAWCRYAPHFVPTGPGVTICK
jgi:hypothetical protein